MNGRIFVNLQLMFITSEKDISKIVLVKKWDGSFKASMQGVGNSGTTENTTQRTGVMR